MDGKTRGYGVQSRLISTHYNHDHYISPYKMLLISNFLCRIGKIISWFTNKRSILSPTTNSYVNGCMYGCCFTTTINC
eukprot:UN08717